MHARPDTHKSREARNKGSLIGLTVWAGKCKVDELSNVQESPDGPLDKRVVKCKAVQVLDKDDSQAECNVLEMPGSQNVWVGGQDTPTIGLRVAYQGTITSLNKESLTHEECKLADALTHMRVHCVLCWLLDDEMSGDHHTGKCYKGGRAGLMFDYTREYRVLAGMYLCYRCLVNMYHLTCQHIPHIKGSCTWSNILPAMAWASWEHEPTQHWVLQEFKPPLSNYMCQQEYTKWLLKKPEKNTLSNLSWVFLFLYETSSAIKENPPLVVGD
jgi:hypothetical protein